MVTKCSSICKMALYLFVVGNGDGMLRSKFFVTCKCPEGRDTINCQMPGLRDSSCIKCPGFAQGICSRMELTCTLHYIALHYIVLYSLYLYCIVLYYIISYHIILYCIILYFIIWLTDLACCDWSIPGP